MYLPKETYEEGLFLAGLRHPPYRFERQLFRNGGINSQIADGLMLEGAERANINLHLMTPKTDSLVCRQDSVNRSKTVLPG